MKKIKSENFNELTPISDDSVDKDHFYCEAIDWALNKDDIRNIALTGVYGSGKSSIIKKYMETHPHEYNYFNVSLASFTGKKNKETNEIERGVLQQLFYQVIPEEIPYSRFKKIKNISPSQIVFRMNLLLITILLGLFLWGKNLLTKIFDINKEWLPKVILILVLLLFLTFSLIISYYVLAFFIRKFKLSKITIEKTGIEFESKNYDSIFNEYMDELIYFFEATNYDVIIFEDLDRFENVIDIFIKLRDLNTIINNYKKITRKIVFLYAIKDDLFKDKERTKFFDFIIPVIPTINNTNSFEILRNKLRSAGIDELKITDDFLIDVSIYIDDMRLLLNIVNEYILYWNKLGNFPRNAEKLLSIIIYKNLCPADFVKLQYNEGLVYEAFEKKKEFQKNITESIRGKIQEKKDFLKQVSRELAENNRDLNLIFLGSLYLVYPENYIYLIYQNDTIEKKDFIENTICYETFLNECKVVHRNSGQDLSARTEVKGLISKISEKQKLIEYKGKEKEDAIKREIENLEKSIIEIQTAMLYELNEIEKVDFDNIYLKKENKIIPFLLRRGYIDESYMNYITVFYEGIFSYEDMNYIMHVKDRIALDYNYKISKPENVIRRLNKRDFREKEFYNYNIVDEILRNSDKYDDLNNVIYENICDGKVLSKEFIKGLLIYSTEKEFLIRVLCKYWRDFWYWLMEESDKSESVILEVFYLIIRYADVEDILLFNKSEYFITYLASCTAIHINVSNLSQYVSKLKKIISRYNVKFKYLDISSGTTELCDYIFENNYYEINKEMIHAALSVYGGIRAVDIETKNYTSIINSDVKWLKGYIDENLQSYIQDVFLELENNDNEDGEVLLQLLNSELEDGLKKEIIKKEKYVRDIIESVDSSLWDTLLDYQRVVPTWANIALYYKKYGYTDSVSTFIKRHITELSNNKMEPVDEVFSNIEESIIMDSDYDLIEFNKLVTLMTYDHSDLDYEDVHENRIRILIDNGLVYPRPELFNQFKKKKTDLHIYLMSADIGGVIITIDDYGLDFHDLHDVIISAYIDDDDKLSLINSLAEKLMSKNNYLADHIAAYLIKKHPKQQLELSLLKMLLKCNNINLNKTSLLLGQAEFLNDSELAECLSVSGEPYSELIVYRQQPKLDNIKENYELIQILKDRGFINSFKVDKKNKLRAYPKLIELA